MNVEYDFLPGPMITPEILKECSDLYSAHYGCWSKMSQINPGENIRLTPDRILEWLNSNCATFNYARVGDRLIGYAIVIDVEVGEKKYGLITWVTQLVVHKDYRKQGIATALLNKIWVASNRFAWGVITANPYAVRALEKVTQRRCLPERIIRNKAKLLSIGIKEITYLDNKTQLDVSSKKSVINTNFYVDHSDVSDMVKKVTTNLPWVMGNLEEGWEWFAFTFKDQQQLSLTPEEIEKMITVSDQITKQAYPKMLLNSEHKWARHTEGEIDFIIKECALSSGDTVLDMGCGQGRHALALAQRGLKVTGIDYISDFIEIAKTNALELKLHDAEFKVADCRNVNLELKQDVVLCLYDVIGSFVNDDDSRNILCNISRNLKSSGIAVISVMNYELTRHMAKHVFSLSNNLNKLLDLKPANIMEETGNVFDPDYYLVDEETRIVYRKELFKNAVPPTELLVRDKRFLKDEIVNLCEESGLKVEWAKYVGAGKWDKPLESTNNSAKEILLFCKKK